MTVKSAAGNHCKKVVRMGLSLFRRGFNSSKCKTMAKMAVARVKLLRNKREVVIKQMRRDIAMLLESGQDATARIRVEHVIREQNIMAANELIELFCELVVARLSIIAKQRECPADLKEGISSLIFAGPRCSDIPELLSIRDVFQKKYGKDFVSTATDLRPNAGVNRLLIEKLSVKTPSGEVKLKVLKEIAKEYQVQWDTAESEAELLKPPEERIVSLSLSLCPPCMRRHTQHTHPLYCCCVVFQDGPQNFVSATSLPLKPIQNQYPNPITASNRENSSNIMSFQDLASAAAAEAAAILTRNSTGKFMPNISPNSQVESNHFDVSSEYGKKMSRRQSYNCQRAQTDIKFDDSDCDEETEMGEAEDMRKINRRHSYNIPPTTRSDVRYDGSDNDDEQNQPPNRAAPQVPVRRVHPNLPDYDALAARFEALKHQKSQPK